MNEHETAAPPDAGADTKTRILDAAFRCLATRGYGALSVREIARDAGVNHALINYHFGTKDRLVIAVLDEANRQLLLRQRLMYAAPGGFAGKWAQARRFYENDIASGFVRVQAELYAASLSNPGLREQFLPRVRAWKQVVLDAVREAFEAYRPALPPAFGPEAVASLLSEFWLGMEFARLIGGPDERAGHEQALDAVQQMLEALDAQAAPAVPAASAAQPPSRAARARKPGSSASAAPPGRQGLSGRERAAPVISGSGAADAPPAPASTAPRRRRPKAA